MLAVGDGFSALIKGALLMAACWAKHVRQVLLSAWWCGCGTAFRVVEWELLEVLSRRS
jgi:hypothetical protein